jgi:hypothetical protein
MFYFSVPDSYTSVFHSSIKGLWPTFQRKDIFYFTTLKRDYCLAASWCCMKNSKDPLLWVLMCLGLVLVMGALSPI